MDANTVAVLGVVGTVVVGPTLAYAFARRKSEVETERIAVDTLGEVIDRLTADLSRTRDERDEARAERDAAYQELARSRSQNHPPTWRSDAP